MAGSFRAPGLTPPGFPVVTSGVGTGPFLTHHRRYSAFSQTCGPPRPGERPSSRGTAGGGGGTGGGGGGSGSPAPRMTGGGFSPEAAVHTVGAVLGAGAAGGASSGNGCPRETPWAGGLLVGLTGAGGDCAGVSAALPTRTAREAIHRFLTGGLLSFNRCAFVGCCCGTSSLPDPAGPS